MFPPDDLTPTAAVQWASIVFMAAVLLLCLIGATTVYGWLF